MVKDGKQWAVVCHAKGLHPAYKVTGLFGIVWVTDRVPASVPPYRVNAVDYIGNGLKHGFDELPVFLR